MFALLLTPNILDDYNLETKYKIADYETYEYRKAQNLC